jgi:molybdopterin-binding protein
MERDFLPPPTFLPSESAGNPQPIYPVAKRQAIAWGVPSDTETIPNRAVFLTIRHMKLSARNQLRGTVEAIVLGVVTAKVGVRVGDNLIESVITRQSVEELNIKVGSEVTAVIKSTEIMIMVD